MEAGARFSSRAWMEGAASGMRSEKPAGRPGPASSGERRPVTRVRTPTGLSTPAARTTSIRSSPTGGAMGDGRKSSRSDGS